MSGKCAYKKEIGMKEADIQYRLRHKRFWCLSHGWRVWAKKYLNRVYRHRENIKKYRED